jgi:hypothetical protein
VRVATGHERRERNEADPDEAEQRGDADDVRPRRLEEERRQRPPPRWNGWATARLGLLWPNFTMVISVNAWMNHPVTTPTSSRRSSQA